MVGRLCRGKPDARELPEGSPRHKSWQPVFSWDQGSQINLRTISCPSQMLIDDGVDSAEKLLLFPKAMLGEVIFLENVPILSQLKFVVGFHVAVAFGELGSLDT